jgi:amino acid transporter/mannitol/fructose-specific phosphotransferase system IIA component (Ntr-type)
MSWFSLTLKSAFALVGMAAFARLLVDIRMEALAIAFCVLFIGLNILGVKQAARAQVLLVVVLLALMALYVAVCLPAVQVPYLAPFVPHGVGAVLSTAGFVFVSYGGLLKIASVAEEIDNPGRDIPLGMILSLLFVGVLYSLMVFVTTGVLPSEKLDGSLTPISDGAAAVLGRPGFWVMSIAAMLAFVTTANAGIMSASRYPLALSRDGLLPRVVGRVHARFRTPYASILMTGAVMVAAMFLKLQILVEAASTTLILTYMLACISVVILHEGRVQNYQPVFRAPLYPWLQIVGILGFGVLIVEMGRDALLVTAALIVCGLLVYWFVGRAQQSAEYALLHLIERLTARELTTRSLESELKGIIRERDRVVEDRFDEAIEQSVVLDIEERISLDELLRMAAASLAEKLGLDPEALFQKLLARERQSTTAISPNLAIPHIIVEGEHRFHILLARCREGAEFSKSPMGVRAVFVLLGTLDERNFHLRALAAIAQIVQDPQFQKRWLRARTSEDLRDVVLLAERTRFASELAGTDP